MTPRLAPAIVKRLFARARADRWGLTHEKFETALTIVAAQGHSLETLHLEDLALAVACADGVESAWEEFVRVYRPTLYRAADAIDPTGGAREAADDLYGELFGLRRSAAAAADADRDGQRRSLFRYYHGRSALGTWLRTVLAQRHVDRVRAVRRYDPLPDEDSARPLAAPAHAPDPEQARFADAMRLALSAAITALAPRDRLRLRLYYTQNLKLAAIGRTLGEHEASASRHLARARVEVRNAVEATLRARYGFDDRAVTECFQRVVDDPGTLDLGTLVGDDDPGKIRAADRSKGEDPGVKRSGRERRI